MRITHAALATDPPYPIMAGDTPLAKDFNKRQKDIWASGKVEKVDYEQVSTVILEILVNDYNKRHASRKRKVKAIQNHDRGTEENI